MPYNLLLLPLLGGFMFLHFTHFFRFRAQRLDGYRLLVESAIAGTLLAVLGRVLVILLHGTHIANLIGPHWAQFAPFEHSDTAAWALLLGPALAMIVNLFLSPERAKDIEIRRHGSALTRLLHEAEQNDRLISVTLDSRKWYVGFVAESPNLDPQELYFRLLPIMSGFRDKDTLEARPTLYYRDALEGEDVDTNDFVITIPMKDVKSANLFDEDLYEEHFAGTQGPAA